jgi:hypothetical protein
MIHWIPQSREKKRKFSVAVLFYAPINTVPGIWWEAGERGNIVPHQIMLGSGVLKHHRNENEG